MDNGTEQRGLGSISIAGFRGIDHLEIPRFGRVTLLAGRNGVGKTTVLEALRIFAARGDVGTLREVLSQRDELTRFRDEDGDLASTAALDRLFHQNGKDRVPVAIGPRGDDGQLKIADVEDLSVLPSRLVELIEQESARVLRIEFDGVCNHYPWLKLTSFRERRLLRALQQGELESPPPLRCESLGPGILRNEKLVTLFDGVVEDGDESLALDALRLVVGDHVRSMAAIGNDYRGSRHVVVRLANNPKPVPLRSLGDGATRMFGVTLALANCQNGILLIDEAENGIHYSLQSDFWAMVLRAAEVFGTQVVATTHSKDCINGFATAALACPNVDGNLVRIGRRKGKLRAVDYSMAELQTAAQQNIEVR